jgi:hypothetical protein
MSQRQLYHLLYLSKLFSASSNIIIPNCIQGLFFFLQKIVTMYKTQDKAFLSHLIPTVKIIISTLCQCTDTTEGSRMAWNLPHSPSLYFPTFQPFCHKNDGSENHVSANVVGMLTKLDSAILVRKGGALSAIIRNILETSFHGISIGSVIITTIIWFLQFFLDVTRCSLTARVPPFWNNLLPLSTIVLSNVGTYLPHYTTSHPRRHNLYIQQCEHLKSHIKILSKIFFYIVNTR